jgi:hypothetical protein
MQYIAHPAKDGHLWLLLLLRIQATQQRIEGVAVCTAVAMHLGAQVTLQVRSWG